MENGPFEDIFPIKNGIFPASYVSLLEGNCFIMGFSRVTFVCSFLKPRLSRPLLTNNPIQTAFLKVVLDICDIFLYYIMLHIHI